MLVFYGTWRIVQVCSCCPLVAQKACVCLENKCIIYRRDDDIEMRFITLILKIMQLFLLPCGSVSG